MQYHARGPLRRALALVIALAIAVLLGACSTRDQPPMVAPEPDAGSLPDAGHAVDAALSSAPVAIVIEPESPSIVVENGEPAEVVFTAEGRDAAGREVRIGPVVWSLGSVEIGAIDSVDGRFVANGAAGGTAVVSADWTDPSTGTTLHGETVVGVTLHFTHLGYGGLGTHASLFERSPVAVDAARAPSVLYPLDGVLLPRNVLPPDVQWDCGGPSDVFRVRLEKPHVHLEAFVGSSWALDYPVDPRAWQALAESEPDEDVVLTVDRWDASHHDVVSSAPVRMRFAPGVVSGQIYYWDLLAGRLLRIHGRDGTRDEFITPPRSPLEYANRCIACHTVSADGRYLAAELWTAGRGRGGVWDLREDLRTDPAVPIWPDFLRDFSFSTFNPTSTRLLAVDITGMFTLFDMVDGQTVASEGLPGPLAGATHPAWSPDGRTLAYIQSESSWIVNFEEGDLVLADVDGDRFGAPRVVHEGSALATATPGGLADAHPSWSPDSRFIAFQHGPYSRSDSTPTGPARSPGALYLYRTDDDSVTRLDRAMGGAEATDSFMPNFSPFSAGGHYWLAFFSKRDYGNSRVGTAGTGRRQLWVAAIDVGAPTGIDPSHAAYWLPGQNVSTENMSGFWAPEACRSTGDRCGVSAECCSGHCRPDAAGIDICQPPPPDACRIVGQTCEESSDCCAPNVCDAHVCTPRLI